MIRPRYWLAGLLTALCLAISANAQFASKVVDSIVATTCTNQLIRSISATGAGTCATVANADLANSSTTVSGTTCTLGSSCTPAVAVTAFVGSSTRDLTTASGTQAITGLGFQPRACSFFGSTGGALGTYTSLYGFVDVALNQRMMGYVGTTLITTLSALVMNASDATNASNATAAVTTLGADGFTLTWTKNGTPSGTFTFAYQCFK